MLISSRSVVVRLSVPISLCLLIVAALSALSQPLGGAEPPTRKPPLKVFQEAIPHDFARSEQVPRSIGSAGATPVYVNNFWIFPGVDWEMKPRFGNDANNNGIPDLPNTFEYVHNLPAGYCA